MDCTDRPVTEGVRENLAGCAAEGLAVLGLDGAATAGERVAAVAGFLDRWAGGERPGGVKAVDVPYLIGGVWGAAIVSACDGWSWAEVVFRRHGDVPAVGVVSADRSMAMFPIHAVAGVVGGEGELPVVAAFEQVRDGVLGGFVAGGYVNVLDVVG